MKQIETANRFIDAMEEAEGTLANVKDKINVHKQGVQKLIERFSKEQKIIIDGVKSEIKAEGSKVIFNAYQQALTEAVDANEKKHEEYIKGTEFINKFEETFIVSVFGKVKSGKSYLGNYIMGSAFKKNKMPSNYDRLGKINVNVYDRGKLTTSGSLSENIDESEGEGFGVASTEATSTIQYFKIGGLTWFDTPGIGSITKENEELAEEYIKNSDLVVFAMNSDAAGTQQEISELKDLYEMNKPMLILITQSDTNDFDVTDDGEMISVLVPKTDKDRSDVEKYIMDTIKEKGMGKALDLSGGKVLTISTKLAVESLKDGKCNDNLYDGSNIEHFVNRLIEITKGEAAELKERNPKDRFNKLVTELLSEIEELDEEVRTINEETKTIQQKAKRVKQNVIANVRYQAIGIIHDKVINASSESKSKESKISGKKIAKEVSGAINTVIKKECTEGMKELIPDIGTKLQGNIMDGNKMKVADMEDKKVSSSYEIEVVNRRKISRGFGGKVLDFFDGGKYETYTTTQTRTIEFTVGNNAAQIEEQLVNHFESVCNTTLDHMVNDIVEGCVKPFQIIYDGFVQLTNDTRKELEKLKIK